jgi:Cu/Ag efflux pump CusA
MLKRLLEFSVRQRVFVLLATVVLVGIGIYSALRLPIDAVPDITNIQVQVNTAVPAPICSAGTFRRKTASWCAGPSWLTHPR